MLKMALLDCAINEKCCSVDGGRGICPFFSYPPRVIWQFESPHPRGFNIQGQKKGYFPGDQRGCGRSWNWLMHKRKSWVRFNFYLYAWPFIHCLYLFKCVNFAFVHTIKLCDSGNQPLGSLRWPEPIYMRVGYVFDLRFSEWKIQPISMIFGIHYNK